MIAIIQYMTKLIDSLKSQFDSRLLYVGLQGSYLRGEASESSDIDIMVIIDKLSVSDLDHYRFIINSMEHAEKSCGFICSKDDLANWNPLEICNLVHGTKDYYGSLKDYVPMYTENDIRNFTKLSLNNLYHEICHRYIHAPAENSVSNLPASYKGVFFILQSLYYLKHGEFIATKSALLPLLDGKNRCVLMRSLEMDNGNSYDFQDSFQLLFSWCQETLQTI